MEKIKDVIYRIINNKWFHYLIITIIGIILSIPLSKIQIRDTHDGSLHLLRVMGTLDTIKIGQIPPIVNQNFCNGLGYAMNLFYPPLVTYIPLLIKLLLPTYSLSLKVFGGICIIFSGITMYNFVYQVTKRKSIALFSAIFYLIAPYKLANIYKRYAIGEFTAFIFIPIVFSGVYNLFNEDGKKHYKIAIGATLLILTHTITTLYTAILCMIYIAFNIKKLKDINICKKIIINIIFIIAMSAMFLFPLIEAQTKAEYAMLDDSIMRTTADWTSNNTISFGQLFKDIQEENGTTFLIGLPTLVILISTIYCFRKVNIKYKDFYITSLLLAFICVYMASNLFPWIIMPSILCKLQYPWRMIGFAIFFISFVCGVNLNIIFNNFIKNNKIKYLVFTILVIITCIYTNNIMLSRFETQNPYIDKTYEEFLSINKKISHKSINRDYMPSKALYLQDTYVEERNNYKTYILNGNANIVQENKQELRDNIKIEYIEKDTILEFPYLYYPGYNVNVIKEGQNKQIKLDTFESKYGYLAISINEDMTNIEINVEYVGTNIMRISYIISSISVVIFLIYIIIFEKIIKNKKD